MSFDRRITPSRPDLADARLRGQVEAERFETGTVRRVVAHSAALRRTPSREAGYETEAIFGESVTVYDEHEGWAWGQLHTDGYVGYLPAEALGEDAGTAPTHKIRALRTFVYPGPSLKLPVTGHLTLNSQVAVADFQGEYARLATGGFIHTAHLASLDAREPDFVAVAERLVGTPYLWGGRTSLGLDCSGLVQTALAAAGIAAPRDSDMQEESLGTPVEMRPDLSGLQRGDLVFWKGHVGVMLDGERLLHANGYAMATAIEPLAVAEERIRTKSYGPITSIRRLPALGA
jgi:cell wall-associated NlpC family hydrolase